MKTVEIEAKNLNEASLKAQEILNLPLDKIKLTLIRENKGFLGIGASQVFEATSEIDIVKEGKEYLESILNNLLISYTIEVKSLNDNKEIYYGVETSENPLLIGKEGRTLEALQVLVKNFIYNFVDEKIVVSVDIGGYKESRKRQLEIIATKVAKEVSRTKIAVKLDPMNAFERRIIHTKLSEWRDVYTESEGEGENRRLVIKPKK